MVLFAAGAVSGFATAYLGSRAARWTAWAHRAFGVVLVGAGVWVLVAPIASFIKQ